MVSTEKEKLEIENRSLRSKKTESEELVKRECLLHVFVDVTAMEECPARHMCSFHCFANTRYQRRVVGTIMRGRGVVTDRWHKLTSEVESTLYK